MQHQFEFMQTVPVSLPATFAGDLAIVGQLGVQEASRQSLLFWLPAETQPLFSDTSPRQPRRARRPRSF